MQALFSIKTQYANAIYEGTKQLELRRYAPRQRCEKIWLYETSPAKSITGYFTPSTVFRRMHYTDLLNAFGYQALIGEDLLRSSFHEKCVQLEGILGTEPYRAIRITNPVKLSEPIDPKTIFARWQAPMSWRYARPSEEALLNKYL